MLYPRCRVCATALLVALLARSAPAGTVARWSFDEPLGAEICLDKGPHDFDLLVGDDGALVSGGKWGNCLKNIAGVSAAAGQVGRVVNIAGTALETVWQSNNFTVEAWLRFDQQPAATNHVLFCGNRTINFLTQGYRDIMGWYWTGADERMHFLGDKPSGIYEHTRVFPFAVGRWHHVAWVRDAASNRGIIYLDGAVIDSDPWGAAPNGFDAAGNPWLTVLTTSYANGGMALAGSIDELTISDEVVYSGGFIPGRPPDLVDPAPTPFPQPTPTPIGFPPAPTPVPEIDESVWPDPIAFQNTIPILPEGVVLFSFDEQAIPFTTNMTFDYAPILPYAKAVLPPAGLNQIGSGFREEGFVGTILYTEGKFRMWYQAKMVGTTDNRQPGFFVCYAESDDGLNWVRPNLGLFTWDNPSDSPDQGPNTNNNICGGTHVTVWDACVLYDPADPDPGRRYKMAYLTFKDNQSWNLDPIGWTELFTSPDGKNWTEIADHNPIKYKMEVTCLYRFKGRYFVGGQQYQITSPLPPGGLLPQRTFSMWTSHVFDQWPDERAVAFYKPLQFSASGSPRAWDGEQMHLAACVWPRGNVCLAVYGQVHTDGYDTSAAKPGLKVLPDGSTADLGLLISNNGFQFREPAPGATLLRHEPLNDNFLIQGTAFLNVGDFTFLWLDNNKLTLMNLRRDGFAYLEVQPPGADSGSFLTENLFAGGAATLHVNVENVSAGDPLELEIVRETAQGYQISQLDDVIESGVHVQVRQGGEPLVIPSGDRFRIRARMTPGQKFYCLYASLLSGNGMLNQAWGGYR